jgi:hypothetical protein
VAITLAQRCLGIYDLGGMGQPIHQLVGKLRNRKTAFSSYYQPFFTCWLSSLFLYAHSSPPLLFSSLLVLVNWRPCCMCYGALLWSGVRELVISGNGPELEEFTGFDEGPIRDDWQFQLEKRGIHVISEVKRDDAVKLWKVSNEKPYLSLLVSLSDFSPLFCFLTPFCSRRISELQELLFITVVWVLVLVPVLLVALLQLLLFQCQYLPLLLHLL